MKDYSWILLSFSLALITTLGALILKYIGINYSKERYKYNHRSYDCCSSRFNFFAILCYNKKKVRKVCQEIHNGHRTVELMIFFMAIIFVLNVCLTIYTLNKVENPAYAQIIKNTNVVFILILSIFLFNSKFNKKCALGVILTIIGIALIIYYNSQ